VGKGKHVVRHVLRHELLLHDVTEGRIRGKATRGQKRMDLLRDLMKNVKLHGSKTRTQDRAGWRVKMS